MKIKILVTALLLTTSAIQSETYDIETTNESTGSKNKLQGGNTYSIRKHTISAGGGVITGGDFTITSSIGQIDAGHNATGGDYTFTGGFLTGSSNSDIIFKNGFE